MSKWFFRIGLCICAGMCGFTARVHAEAPPNVVIIFTDDQGYQDVGCFGSPKIRTPNLDRMAENGTRFTSFYSACSVCSPSRAALLTGCYPQRTGITRVLFPNAKEGLNEETITIARLLKGKGYATACVGKWHLGHKPGNLPTDRGFDSYFGIPYSNDMSLDREAKLADDIVLREGVTLETIRKGNLPRNKVPLMRGREVIEYPADQSLLTRRYTEEAIEFIRRNREKPFLLYLPHTMPHIPLFASEEFKGRSARGRYGDTIEEIDWSTGEILGTLGELGLADRTLVVYTSDNGPWNIGERGGCALPLRGWKGQTYEGGMRVPCLMQWPGTIPAGRVTDELMATIDLFPTIARMAGAAVGDQPVDGHDMLDFLKGKAASPRTEFCYIKSQGGRFEAIRSGKWKLRMAGKETELFDLEADLRESRNLAGEHPGLVKRLAERMAEWEDRTRGGR